jgi:DNA polymerase-1
MEQVELPLVPVVADLEEAGYGIDVPFFKALPERLASRLDEVLAALRATAGPDFDPAAAQAVFESADAPLAATAPEAAEGADPADESAGRGVPDRDKLAPLLRDYRRLTSRIHTYGRLHEREDADGWLRVPFDPLGTQTGRFTSASVIQTVPGDDPERLRDGFVAGPGCRLVAADYRQQELQLLAALSGDSALLAAVRQGIDLHGLAAVQLFGLDCPPNEVRGRHPAERDRVKAEVFGLIYGGGALSLAEKLGIGAPEARRLIDDYFRAFPAVEGFVEEAHARVVRDGFVQDVFGRRRYLPDAQIPIPPRPYHQLSESEREAARRVKAAHRAAQNFLVQAPGATVTKLAMLNCHRHLAAARSAVRMILTLHDELHFEVPEAEVGPFAAELPALMRDLGLERFGLSAPLTVGVKEGPSWGRLRPVPAPEE